MPAKCVWCSRDSIFPIYTKCWIYKTSPIDMSPVTEIHYSSRYLHGNEAHTIPTASRRARNKKVLHDRCHPSRLSFDLYLSLSHFLLVLMRAQVRGTLRAGTGARGLSHAPPLHPFRNSARTHPHLPSDPHQGNPATLLVALELGRTGEGFHWRRNLLAKDFTGEGFHWRRILLAKDFTCEGFHWRMNGFSGEGYQ